MDVFQEYKPLRNKIRKLARDDALGVIWAYCQYLQIDDFRFPKEIEIHKRFFEHNVPRAIIAEWELELLAKEVILNGNLVAKNYTLRKWDVIAEIVNGLKDLEGRIYKEFGSQEKVLVELIRIAHREFIWQSNPPNAATTIRYFKILNRPIIDEICMERIGLNIWQTFMCGIAYMGHFLERPAIKETFRSEIKALPVEVLQKFLTFTARPISELKSKLKTEQQYNENFAYAYNSLRAYPLINMFYQGEQSIVCPLLTLLFWRFTGGLYYEFIDDPRFPNEFGGGFQKYVGEVIERACPDPKILKIPEEKYVIGKQEKRTVDWIVGDGESALFLECKSKRLSWGAKVSLTNLQPLESDISNMAAAVVQIYKTVADYQANLYPNFSAKEGRRIFPAIVTLENWRMFGPVMMNKLGEAVQAQLNAVGLSPQLPDELPYSIWAIEELEVGLQIISSVGIAKFMDGKLKDREMRQWDWHGYMINKFKEFFPREKLFDKEYDDMFSDLVAAQNS